MLIQVNVFTSVGNNKVTYDFKANFLVKKVSCKIILLQTTKCFMPSMMMHNKGHVVTIASVGGVVRISQLMDYCSSKFGTMGFTESLEIEMTVVGKNGINVTTVYPYFIRTGLFEGSQGRLVNAL